MAWFLSCLLQSPVLNGGILFTLSLKFFSLQSDYMQAFLKKDIII